MIASIPLTAVHKGIHDTQHVMASVLRKLPRETVPADLLWALYRIESWTFSGEDSVTVRTCFGEHNGTLPLTVLGAPEQNVRAWTRQTYWSGRERAAQEATADAYRDMNRLRVEAQRAEQAVQEAQQRYEQAAALRERVAAQRAARRRAKAARIGATR